MDGDNTVRAVDLASGDTLWSHKITVEATGRTRTGKTGIIERVKNPLSFGDKGGSALLRHSTLQLVL